VSLQFNIVPDEELKEGFRVGGLQFNDMLVKEEEMGLLQMVYRNG
jgi:hypothetical protein